jgi:hypothetical protein
LSSGSRPMLRPANGSASKPSRAGSGTARRGPAGPRTVGR